MYRAMQDSMRDGLVSGHWRNVAKFVGYNAVGPSHFGRWGAWADYSLITEEFIDPSPLMWDGGSSSYYVDNWNSKTDFKVFSPQIEFMNLVFMNSEARRLNPNFWFEMSVWDGFMPDDPETDKRSFYESLGQAYSPERYAGTVQFGMWLLRPKVVRQWQGWTFPREDGDDYFMALVEVVDRIHLDTNLRYWWQSGELVVNPKYGHPYQDSVPTKYLEQSRWFLLDANINPPRPWQLSTKLQVYAIALERTVKDTREWLIYAHAPLGDRNNVVLALPGFGEVAVDVAVEGSYFVVDELTGRANPISSPPGAPGSVEVTRDISTIYPSEG